MLLFIRKIMEGQKKIYIFLLAVLSMLSAFEFILLSIYSSYQETLSLQLLMVRSIASIIIFILLFLTLLINNYFLNSKNEELSVILLTGCVRSEIVGYIVIQFGILFIMADILGIPLGIIVSSLIKRVYSFQSDYTILFEGYFGMLVCKLVYVLVLNLGKFVRLKMDMIDFISRKSPKIQESIFSGRLIENSKTKSKIMSFLMLIISIILIYGSIEKIYTGSDITIIGLFGWFIIGEVIFINKVVPFLFSILHNKIMLALPQFIMIMSNVLDVFRSLSSIINVSICVIPICLSYFFYGVNDDKTIMIIFICYFILLIMLFISFILRFYVYIPSVMVNIATMKALGYDQKSLNSIFRNVVIGLLFLIMGIPVALYSIILYEGYLLTYISPLNFILLITSAVVMFLMLGMIIYMKYIKTIQEVYEDVKYLNRG